MVMYTRGILLSKSSNTKIYRKAFDCVNYQKIITILKCAGIGKGGIRIIEETVS